MLPAHLAAQLLKQQREAEAAEFARQLPLYADDPTLMAPPDEEGAERRPMPDWAVNY